jgi:integrase
MGTIVERPRKDGSSAFLAQISIMRDGKNVFRQSKTFDRRPAATAWIKKRETDLAKPGGLTQARTGKASATLADAIDRYIGESRRQIGKTKAQVLRKIKEFDIASMRCDQIGSQDIVTFAKAIGETVMPQTVGNYMAHLGAVFATARPAWGYPLDQQAMADAVKVAKSLGLTSKSRERNRRPTLAELDALMRHFTRINLRRPKSLPMPTIVAFAIFSTRRQEEITRLRWNDLDEVASRTWVRDMKTPGDKIGNDVLCDLPAEALRIARLMPRDAQEIFPFGASAISAAFTRACKFLQIQDLHFHDLRHDGVSRLFELGKSIPQVAAISGHRSWSSLKRYTHLRQTGDKYAHWPWLDSIAPQ